MAEQANRYTYKVGYLTVHDRQSGEQILAAAGDGGDPVERLTILGEYDAATPEGACEAALADKSNGGLPNHLAASLVAVVKSRWYVIDATGEETVQYSLSRRGTGAQGALPVEEGQGQASASTADDGGGIAP